MANISQESLNMSKNTKITIELTEKEAEAYAQFLERIIFDNYLYLAVSDDEECRR